METWVPFSACSGPVPGHFSSKGKRLEGARRIRWTDATGKRRSQTFTEKKTAELALRKADLETEERRRGLRPPEPEPRTFLDAAAYWRSHRAAHKRSEGDDLSMLRQLELHFGKVLLNCAVLRDHTVIATPPALCPRPTYSWASAIFSNG